MKIALVAMSGIRVCDEELLRMGLTLPGFVERSKVIASLPSLGLLTLAGMLPDHHEVSYIEVDDIDKNPALFDQLSGFDLVAISSFSAQILEAYQLADLLRGQGVRVVMGGLHVTCMPDEAGQHCDAVLVGEGELAWPQLVSDAEQDRLQPRYGSVAEEFDLTQAPMPAFELLDMERYNRLTIQTSRGCAHKCEFCASSILLTSQYKQKPAARVLAELDRIVSLWQHPFIEFADDNTFVNKKYWRELLPEIAARKIRWFTETDISIARDEELLRLMRESGCAQVLIGLESPSAASLQGLETRNNWKARQQAGYMEGIRTIQGHGISVNGCFILGLDDHDHTIFDRVYDFVEESGLHEVQITLQTPFPGTPLYSRLREEGRIVEDGAWNRCTLFDINFEPRGMTRDQLADGFKELTARLYSDECTRRRRTRFREQLRQSVHDRSERKAIMQ
jgi:radical SAM superfamily enzyme YgiQ (UPF0313 family)